MSQYLELLLCIVKLIITLLKEKFEMRNKDRAVLLSFTTSSQKRRGINEM